MQTNSIPFFLLVLLAAVLCTSFTSAAIGEKPYVTEDLYVSPTCDEIAMSGDHILLEYSIIFANGTEWVGVQAPQQLYHVALDISDTLPVKVALKGMCSNSTRKLTWKQGEKMNSDPIFISKEGLNDLDEEVSLVMKVRHITTQDNYQIFNALAKRNISQVLDLIDEHKGINAVDEWGQTVLMIAVSNNQLDVVSALLNTRRPRVDINMAKSSGFTALFYAVEKGSPDILAALLRRGADPNMIALQENAKGNTPLHFAALLAKQKHAELLLEYGANPFAENQYGQNALQLLPHDEVRSTKLYFKKIFEEAGARKIKEDMKSKEEISSPKSNEL